MIIQILGIISKKKMENDVKPFTKLSVLRRNKSSTIHVSRVFLQIQFSVVFFILDSLNSNKAFYLIVLNTFFLDTELIKK